ncbi:MAG: lamin tail domain-containing protein [Caldilineales bacterium]|nr:lamin tail domain-containing protein [Caldilineales bacterium]
MKRKKRLQFLFWALIALVLLLGMGRILADPQTPTNHSRSPVVISELVTANRSGLRDEDGAYSDWVELVNRSGHSVNMAGWTLTDDTARPDQWMFPDVTIGPGEYLVVFASGKDRAQTSAEGAPTLHANFRLSGGGETIALYPPTSRRYQDVVSVHYPRLGGDQTFGLCEDGESYCLLSTPTPGAANAAAIAEHVTWRDATAPVQTSVGHGIFQESFELTLTSATPDAEIFYTTDGSGPSPDNGLLYEQPLAIDHTTTLRAVAVAPDLSPSPIATQSYLFIDDVLAQGPHPPGFPETWGTHRLDFEQFRAGDPVIGDYEMDPAIVGDPAYRDQLADALLALPAISLVTDVDNLDIYFNDPQARGPEAERPVSVELIDPAGAEPGFQIDAGVRIQGGVARWEYMFKHPFRLFFKSDYGPGQLNYKLFLDSFVDAFDTVILRSGANRTFTAVPPENALETTYTRDEWARRSQIAMSDVGLHGRFVHLFLNGLYWGLYNLAERPDQSFMASYFGGDKSDYFSANHGGAIEGMPDRLNVLLELATQGGLADPDRYATMLEFIDPGQFSDYVLLNWYAGTRDWPETNWYAGVHYPAGRNTFFEWDAEGSWNDGAEVRLGEDGKEGAPYPNVTKLIFNALAENPESRLTFADRAYKHLFNDGALTDENAKERWLAVNAEVEDAILAESARWGDVRYQPAVMPEDWARARDHVLAQMEGNAAKLVGLLREAGLYPALDPPMWSHPGGEFAVPLELVMSTPNGEIFYTLDGSDPRQTGSGEPASAAMRYANPIRIEAETVVKARTFANGEWSPLREARFVPAGSQPDLRISEIMYNPPGSSNYEFIELTNFGDASLDLSLANFTGINFIFPLGSRIEPGESLVLIRDFPAFRSRYAAAPFAGIYTGALANEGETITLRDRFGSVLTSVSYEPDNGWPLSADGRGDSLTLWRLGGDPNDPSSWRASRQALGTPGSAAEARR